MMDQYYFRLKEDVKDKILRADRPTTLQGIVELAVRVNNRQYKRRIEKSGRKALKPYVITKKKTVSRY